MINGEWISRRSYTEGLFKNLKKSGDLISRQAAIDLLDALLENTFDNLCEVPTAEKKGKWLMTDDKYIDVCKCSECGAIEYFNKGWKKFAYCPNCGARMTEA